MLGIFILCGIFSLVIIGEPTPFSVENLLSMERISEPALSPQGNWIVFSLQKIDMNTNKSTGKLYLLDVKKAIVSPLTSGNGSDYNPVWSADQSAIYFLSSRSSSSQIWKIDINSKSETQISNYPLDVNSFKLSPCGKTFVFAMEVFPCLKTIEESAAKLEEQKNKKASGRIYNRLFFRHWDTWMDGRRSQLFTVPVSGGKAVNIMHGFDGDCPTKPFGGSEEYTFTPDSSGIVFTSKAPSPDEAWTTNFDLFLAKINGEGQPINLTAGNTAWDTQPVFSNNGKTLAYLAMSEPIYEADRYQIILRDWTTGTERKLAANWDRSGGNLLWGPKDRFIYTSTDNIGQKSLFAIDVAKGTVQTIVKDGHTDVFAIFGKTVFLQMDHFQSPVELYSIETTGKKLTQLTFVNKDKLAATKLGDFEQFSFPGWNNETVYGFIVKPVNFDPAKKYPIAFLIHGGPQGSFSNNFHYRWNPQVYAGAGYAAIMIDFHGSTGYGKAFTDSIQGDWGGKPLEDLQKGLKAATAKYPWLDENRAGALGASYGGYMINWIAGNWPDRFRCLVNHDGNLDEKMAYYDTEELWFPERDHQGTPWDNPENYEKQSPINFIKNWQTPTLVIHGGLDFRVVETQGMSTFTALQRRGIPSKFLYFPDENHWVLKPHNALLWHQTVIGWLDYWVKPDHAPDWNEYQKSVSN
jgi:dipeptidyl aminopeptidase/acylaminoacyl peptidase